MIPLPIDERGRKFMLEFLEPENTISGRIVQENPTWSLRAIVPELTPVDRAYAFEAGGLCGMDESREWLFNTLQNVETLGNIKTLLVEDIWAKPEDVYKEHDSRLKPIWVDVSQFYGMDITDIEAELLQAFLNIPLSFYNAIIGVSSEIDVLNASSIRVSAKFVLMTAYGFESFIFSGDAALLDGKGLQ